MTSHMTLSSASQKWGGSHRLTPINRRLDEQSCSWMDTAANGFIDSGNLIFDFYYINVEILFFVSCGQLEFNQSKSLICTCKFNKHCVFYKALVLLLPMLQTFSVWNVGIAALQHKMNHTRRCLTKCNNFIRHKKSNYIYCKY